MWDIFSSIFTVIVARKSKAYTIVADQRVYSWTRLVSIFWRMKKLELFLLLLRSSYVNDYLIRITFRTILRNIDSKNQEGLTSTVLK